MTNVYHDCSRESPFVTYCVAQHWTKDHILDGLCIILALLATLLGFGSVSDLRTGVIFVKYTTVAQSSDNVSESYLLSAPFTKAII